LSTAPYSERAYYNSRNKENQGFFAETAGQIQKAAGLPTPYGVGVVIIFGCY